MPHTARTAWMVDLAKHACSRSRTREHHIQHLQPCTVPGFAWHSWLPYALLAAGSYTYLFDAQVSSSLQRSSLGNPSSEQQKSTSSPGLKTLPQAAGAAGDTEVICSCIPPHSCKLAAFLFMQPICRGSTIGSAQRVSMWG